MSMPIVKTKHLLEANHRAAERIKELEGERDKLKESISHFSGLLGEETQKRYALEAERDRAVELLTDVHYDWFKDSEGGRAWWKARCKLLIGEEAKNG